VIATDSQRMTATDLFSVTMAPVAAHATSPTAGASFASLNPSQMAGLLAYHA
jgi:hypothetical protein